MWHEARKQEKKLRGMMVDYKKRAERRRQYYERMRLDPTQLLRIYGQKCKIHIDPQVAAAGDSKTVMMPWQGNPDYMIDRFDGRAHLDYIPEYSPPTLVGPVMETDPEEHRLNYERYRTLLMVEYSGVSQESYLQQIAVEELNPPKKDVEKKEKSSAKATIGYSYEDSAAPLADDSDADSDSDMDSDSILSDIDVTIDIDELTKQQVDELDTLSIQYGVGPSKFCRNLKADKDEAELQRRVKQEEEERALITGRKSRKERRSLRERQRQKFADSPPSYARRNSPTYEPYRQSRSRSRSSSRSVTPENTGEVEFITEFGGTVEQPDDGDKHSHTTSPRQSETVRKNVTGIEEDGHTTVIVADIEVGHAIAAAQAIVVGHANGAGHAIGVGHAIAADQKIGVIETHGAIAGTVIENVTITDTEVVVGAESAVMSVTEEVVIIVTAVVNTATITGRRSLVGLPKRQPNF